VTDMATDRDVLKGAVIGAHRQEQRIQKLEEVVKKVDAGMKDLWGQLMMSGQVIRKLLEALGWSAVELTPFEIQMMSGKPTINVGRRMLDGAWVFSVWKPPEMEKNESEKVVKAN